MTAVSSTTSLSGLGLSGLSSGLDTSGIITKLMAIESAPQTLLKSKLSDATSHRTALQSLNTSVAALATSASAAARPGALTSFTASTDSDAVKASASSSASAGSVSFTVDSLATAQVSVTSAMTTWPDASSSTPSITIQVGSGSPVTLTAASTDLDDVASAINASGTGVVATKIATGTPGSYRLQLRGATGAGNAFSVYEGSSTAATQLPTTQVSTAQSAQITLYKGVSGAEQQVTSTTNTFSSLLTGVDITVSAVAATASTVTVIPDSAAATTAATSLTAGLSTLLAGIASASAITTTASTTGASSSTTGGVFTGDSLVRSVKDALLSAVTKDLPGGVSPATIGVNITKDGSVTFDSTTFQAAMAKDSTTATAVLQKIAANVAKAANDASLPSSGTLSQKITSQQTTESDLTKQISTWDDRLAVIQAQYTAQFNALETALNSLSSQASYLTSQIAGLTTNYQSTK